MYTRLLDQAPSWDSLPFPSYLLATGGSDYGGLEGALVLESSSTDRLLSEPHLDHIIQEGAFAASEPMEPWLIGHNSQYAFSRGRRDGEQGSLAQALST